MNASMSVTSFIYLATTAFILFKMLNIGARVYKVVSLYFTLGRSHLITEKRMSIPTNLSSRQFVRNAKVTKPCYAHTH